jgi:hypothetical protein
MKAITSLLSLLLGANTLPKNSLHKKPTKEDHFRNLNCWVYRNFYSIALVFLVLVFVTFIFVCFTVCGVSATESGMMRNFINGGVI